MTGASNLIGELGLHRFAHRDLQIARRRSANLLHRRAHQTGQSLARLSSRRADALDLGSGALDKQTRGVTTESRRAFSKKSSGCGQGARGPLTHDRTVGWAHSPTPANPGRVQYGDSVDRPAPVCGRLCYIATHFALFFTRCRKAAPGQHQGTSDPKSGKPAFWTAWAHNIIG